jgi:phosphoribosylglycinamide formyltransferase-1
MKRIAVLVSGGGTNLQALIDAWKADELGNGELSLVVSSCADAKAIQRAQDAGIKTITIEKKSMDNCAFDTELAKVLCENKTDLVVLAGFLCVIGPQVLKSFENKIINVHPSLIPSFSGKGSYGLRVHEAALEYGVKITGATVHFVNEVIDGGKIILQKCVDVLPDDTPETLQQRVMREAEWVLLPKAVALLCSKLGESTNGANMAPLAPRE